MCPQVPGKLDWEKHYTLRNLHWMSDDDDAMGGWGPEGDDDHVDTAAGVWDAGVPTVDGVPKLRGLPTHATEAPAMDNVPTHATFTSEAFEVIQGINQEIRVCQTKFTDLSRLVQGMEAAYFTDEERDVVGVVMQHYAHRRHALQSTLDNKSKLYEERVRSLENILSKRRLVLEPFDDLLADETAIATIVINYHNQLEKKLLDYDSQLRN